MLALAVGLALFLAAAMATACRVALATNQSGKIDAIWTFSTGVASVAAAFATVGDAHAPRQVLVAAIAVIWMLRLGIYMWRRASHGPDDPRYAALKREWGDSAASKLFCFLQAQAVASWPLVLAAFVAAHAPREAFDLRDIVGAVVFALAIAGESVADRQMAAFRRDPANKGNICDTGLWAWSRHPNYFFEWLGWFAYPLIAIQSGYWPGLLALGAPAVMYWLLVHVSGVPPLERELQRSRPEAFAAYKAKVSEFWPRAPG